VVKVDTVKEPNPARDKQVVPPLDQASPDRSREPEQENSRPGQRRTSVRIRRDATPASRRTKNLRAWTAACWTRRDSVSAC